jgi:hypothetical protein
VADEIYTRSTSAEVRTLIWGLVTGLSGRSGDHGVLVRGIKLRVGLTALMLVTEAFDAKADHAAGDDGIQWDELAQATIAARRMGPGDTKMLKGMGITKRGGVMGKRSPSFDVRGRPMRAFLSEAQDKRWRMIFATRMAYFRGKFGMDETAAAAHAAQTAWATLKREGALTKLEVLGSRTVQIGKDTGRLAASLTPGLEEPASLPLDAEPPPPNTVATSKADDRILRTDPGVVIVGSNVEYASSFHKKRPLWPDNGLPAAWNAELAQVCGGAVSEAIVMILEQAA